MFLTTAAALLPFYWRLARRKAALRQFQPAFYGSNQRKLEKNSARAPPPRVLRWYDPPCSITSLRHVSRGEGEEEEEERKAAGK